MLTLALTLIQALTLTPTLTLPLPLNLRLTLPLALAHTHPHPHPHPYQEGFEMLLDADELLALPFLGPRVARSAASTPVGRCAMHACDARCHAPRTVPCTMHHALYHAPRTAPCTTHHAPRTMYRP